MSWRGGRGGGGGRFDRGGRRGGGGRFGGRGRGDYYEGPPEEVVEAGVFQHVCEGEAVCKLTNEKIPYFNANIFLENKTAVGKVDEIFGGINSPFFTIKCQDGVVASSFPADKKFFIDPAKLLPLERFLPRPKGAPAGRGGRGRGRGGRGGRGLGVRGGGRFGGGGGRFSPGGRGRGGFRGARGGRSPGFSRGRGRY